MRWAESRTEIFDIHENNIRGGNELKQILGFATWTLSHYHTVMTQSLFCIYKTENDVSARFNFCFYWNLFKTDLVTFENRAIYDLQNFLQFCGLCLPIDEIACNNFCLYFFIFNLDCRWRLIFWTFHLFFWKQTMIYGSFPSNWFRDAILPQNLFIICKHI